MPRQKKLPDEIEIGDIVRHPKWGEGTVLSKSGRGENAKVTVVFSEAGQKKLLVKYAKLKKVGMQPTAEQKTAPEPPAEEFAPVEEEVPVEEMEETGVLEPEEEFVFDEEPAFHEEEEETETDEENEF